MKDNGIFTIVVADDEEELREAVCQMIDWEAIGYRLVGSAGNGLDALQLVEQLQPDLLLTDIRMPFISGTELAKQVRELRPLTQIAFLSGYDDFEYAQQAIACNVVRYLLKPISMAELTKELSEIHQKIARQYRAFLGEDKVRGDWRDFLMPLLLDGFADEQDELRLSEDAVQCGLIPSAQTPVRMLVLVTEFFENGQNATAKDLSRSVDLILEKYHRPFSFFSGGRIVTLLLGRQESLGELNLVLDELIQAVSRVMRLQCAIGVSRPFHAFSRCHRACREAVDALQLTGPADGGVHFIADAAAAAPSSDDPGLGEEILQLETVLRGGSRAQLEKALGDLFVKAGEDADLAAMQVAASVFRMVYATGNSEEIAALRSRFRMQDLLFQRAEGDRLFRAMTELCVTARELLSDQRREGVSLMCQQALEQINRNYMDDLLSLGSVSDFLHVSPNYLSANMKKYAGDTFMNLLIKKRMEVAGELLSTTNLKILEVSRRCGYTDQHYFSFCFKKYHGVSPVMLRRQRQGELT